MKRLLFATMLVAISACCGSLASADEAPPPEKLPKPKAVPQPAPEAVDKALRGGIVFLLKDQNKDGSWGTAQRTKGLNVWAPVPDGHNAFRAAVTALCVMALIETGDGSTDLVSSVEKGEEWLLKNLPLQRRSDEMTLYNIWAHGYGIQALVRMHGRLPHDTERRHRIEAEIRNQVSQLARYESVDGGWGYLDMKIGAKRPSTDSTPFMNAAELIALHEAKTIGIELPEKVVKRAIDSTVRQRKPDFTYLYGEYMKYSPMHPVNRPGGSLGRSQCCNLALRLWGDKKVTDEVLVTWLDRLFARNLWLDMGRKRPIPHESHFSVAGYFFYYGHYYAALCMELLKPEARPFYQDHLATVLLPLQEKDGSWWDYPLYNYHQQYGTAFALMSLKRCQRPASPQTK